MSFFPLGLSGLGLANRKTKGAIYGIINFIVAIFYILFFFHAFGPRLWRVDIPEPGIELMPQQ